MNLIQVSKEDKRRIQSLELEIMEEIDRICKKYNIKYTLAYGTLIGAIRHNGFIPWDDDIDIAMLRPEFNKFREVCKTELGDRFFYQSHKTDPEYYYLFDKVRLNNTIFKESFLSKYKIHHGVYIDIFPVDYMAKKTICKKLQYSMFRILKAGLASKYLMLRAREGKKKYQAAALRVIFFPFSIDFLYRLSEKIATKYLNSGSNTVINFFTPYRLKEIFNESVYKEYDEHIFEGRNFSIIKNYDLFLKQIYGNYMQLPPVEKRDTRHTITELKL